MTPRTCIRRSAILGALLLAIGTVASAQNPPAQGSTSSPRSRRNRRRRHQNPA